MKNVFQLLCLSVCLFVRVIGLDRRPTISFITQPEIVTDIGGTIEMLCSVQYAQDYPVIWMKLDQVIVHFFIIRHHDSKVHLILRFAVKIALKIRTCFLVAQHM